jgi:hypothetical protein
VQPVHIGGQGSWRRGGGGRTSDRRELGLADVQICEAESRAMRGRRREAKQGRSRSAGGGSKSTGRERGRRRRGRGYRAGSPGVTSGGSPKIPN